MKTKMVILLAGIFGSLIGSQAWAESPPAPKPHFFVQMENKSEKPAYLNFKQGVGNITLTPQLMPQTPVSAQTKSDKYEVTIEPLNPASTFNISFTGSFDCNFNVGYYSPGNPKVTISGYGCKGGGYDVIDQGKTLLLYVTDIRRQS